jgi:hypothetical protein
MDLSSLQNDLPRGGSTKPPTPLPPPSLPPLTLTSDFKAAALAVTKLYQNSARQIDLARQEGYLSAVQEVAALLSDGELAGNRLREWCAVGLSRITARQEEENRARSPQRTEEEGVNREEENRRGEMTPPASSPVTGRMQLPLQHAFGQSDFTFQSPLTMDVNSYRSPFGLREDAEVTYEVIDNHGGREGGRKRGVSHQQPVASIWDVNSMGNKRSRHI